MFHQFLVYGALSGIAAVLQGMVFLKYGIGTTNRIFGQFMFGVATIFCFTCVVQTSWTVAAVMAGTIAGVWAGDHGKILFFDLRDRYRDLKAQNPHWEPDGFGGR